MDTDRPGQESTKPSTLLDAGATLIPAEQTPGPAMPNQDHIVVAGAGGLIGGHLVAAFRKKGYSRVRAVDVKPLDQWSQRFYDVENLQLDLNLRENCEITAQGADEIYNLAANMGGMGL